MGKNSDTFMIANKFYRGKKYEIYGRHRLNAYIILDVGLISMCLYIQSLRAQEIFYPFPL